MRRKRVHKTCQMCVKVLIPPPYCTRYTYMDRAIFQIKSFLFFNKKKNSSWTSSKRPE